ncbi:MAG: helix-turn-helix transcriptional regulator [Xylophilus ampelinus]
MVRFKLRRLMEEFEQREQRRLTFTEVAEATGIVRTTLSKMVGPKPFNTTTDNLAKLCEFFGCQMGDLVEYVAEPAAAKDTTKTALQK